MIARLRDCNQADRLDIASALGLSLLDISAFGVGEPNDSYALAPATRIRVEVEATAMPNLGKVYSALGLLSEGP